MMYYVAIKLRKRLVLNNKINNMMKKKYYFYKLIAPRPTFHLDMSSDEQKIMEEHMAYWEEIMKKRIGIIYGLVYDPEGVFGMAIIETEDDPNFIAKNDPAVKTGVCTYSIYPMQIGMMRE